MGTGAGKPGEITAQAGARRIRREPRKITGPGMDPPRTTFQKPGIRTSCGAAFAGKTQSSPLRADFWAAPGAPHPGAKNPQREICRNSRDFGEFHLPPSRRVRQITRRRIPPAGRGGVGAAAEPSRSLQGNIKHTPSGAKTGSQTRYFFRAGGTFLAENLGKPDFSFELRFQREFPDFHHLGGVNVGYIPHVA